MKKKDYVVTDICNTHQKITTPVRIWQNDVLHQDNLGKVLRFGHGNSFHSI